MRCNCSAEAPATATGRGGTACELPGKGEASASHHAEAPRNFGAPHALPIPARHTPGKKPVAVQAGEEPNVARLPDLRKRLDDDLHGAAQPPGGGRQIRTGH